MSRPAVSRIDVIPMGSRPVRDTIRSRLDDLLTRCFYSAAGYVFESDPHAVAADDELIRAFGEIRAQDRRHASVLGQLVQAQGGVPQPGVFPWWDQDLNYLTVPTLATFVCEVLADEIGRYGELIARWPDDDLTGRAALEAVRAEKVRQVEALRPLSVAAVAREAEARKAAAAALKKAREARLAKEKAAAEAARKAKTAQKGAPVAQTAAAPTALLDPNEPGISKKEKGRRAVMKIRAALGIATRGSSPAAAAPAAAPAAAGADLPDPNEPGISPKERARRTMLKMRAAAGGGAAAAPASAAPSPAASPPAAAPAADLPDPNEAGISPKEKARRTMMKMRAAASPATSSPAAAAPAPAATAPAPATAAAPAAAAPGAASAATALPADLGDPDEAGISPKEKARRTMARLRAKKG